MKEAIKEPVEAGPKFCRQATVHFAGEIDNTEDMSNCWAITLFITPLAMIVIFIIVALVLSM